MISVDPTSTILAELLYAAFLILGVVLLINMLIALLTNTYQKTEVKTWRSVLKLLYEKRCGVMSGGFEHVPVNFKERLVTPIWSHT